jgi:geranylgeranyl diphosphate synthase type 3
MFGMRMLQLYSDNKTDFTKLGDILGLYFQIRDDYCNLCLEQVISELSSVGG